MLYQSAKSGVIWNASKRGGAREEKGKTQSQVNVIGLDLFFDKRLSFLFINSLIIPHLSYMLSALIDKMFALLERL